jgi:hypothetical protein
VRAAVASAIDPYRRGDGGYTLENTFRFATGRNGR